MAAARSHTSDKPVTLHVGHDELVIRGRYETLSIANDILIGVIFLVGSFLFLSESTTVTGTWLFVGGSGFMLVRPLIRLVRRIHLRKIDPGADPATSRDF